MGCPLCKNNRFSSMESFLKAFFCVFHCFLLKTNRKIQEDVLNGVALI